MSDRLYTVFKREVLMTDHSALDQDLQLVIELEVRMDEERLEDYVLSHIHDENGDRDYALSELPASVRKFLMREAGKIALDEVEYY
jgi:hypothetical protein